MPSRYASAKGTSNLFPPTPPTISSGASPAPNCTSSMQPISWPWSNTAQPTRSLTNAQPDSSSARWLRGTCNSHPTRASASSMESTSANFSTTMPLCAQRCSISTSRRDAPDLSSADNRIPLAKRSGTSLCTSAAISPCRPCVLTTRASVMNSSLDSGLNAFQSSSLQAAKSRKMGLARLLNDLERIALAGAVSGGSQQGTQRAGGASLTAYDLSYVILGDFQFD